MSPRRKSRRQPRRGRKPKNRNRHWHGHGQCANEDQLAPSPRLLAPNNGMAHSRIGTHAGPRHETGSGRASARPCTHGSGRSAFQRAHRRENLSALWCCEQLTRSRPLAPPVRGFQMHNHPRPHGFGGLVPNGKTDATSHATRDNRPELVAIEPESVDVGTRHGSAVDFVGHARLPRLPIFGWHAPSVTG